MKNKVFVLVFVLLAVSLSVLTLALPKKEFSDNENRMLAVSPRLSWESVRDGSFMEDVGDWLSDHFVGRDLWVSVKTAASVLTLQNEQNGVYRAKGGGYIDGFAEEDTENFEKNLAAVAEFTGIVQNTYAVPVYTLIAPTATVICENRLPLFAAPLDAGPYFSALAALPGFVDTRAVLSSHRDEAIYYQTDHHWTAKGAYLAYTALKAAQGEPARAQADYGVELVTDRFFGTLYSRFGLFDGKNPDAVYAPAAETLGPLTLTDSKGEQSASVYFPDRLSGKDKYQYFLGGNDSRLEIETQNGSGKRLLLIKDSYANAFLPYLIPDYAAVTVIDLRYFKDTVLSLFEDGAYTDVLILYNLKSFASDDYVQFLPLAD